MSLKTKSTQRAAEFAWMHIAAPAPAQRRLERA
jgi:hypothetical protein